MNSFLQKIAKDYYEKRTVQNFNAYYHHYQGIATAAASGILRDISQAQEVVNDLFTKFHNRDDDSFQFDDTKSHVGYIWHSAANLAKIKWNKNRIKVNNLGNCESRTDHLELDYMSKILINETENIQVRLGFSRKDHIKCDDLLCFYGDKLIELEGTELEDTCQDFELELIDEFLDSYGCTTTSDHRIRKTLKIKRSESLTYCNLLDYIKFSMNLIDRLIEISQAKTIEDIKKIKSKATRKKIGKVLFENTKVNLLVCESDFKDDNETGDTLEYLGYVNGGNYTIDNDLEDDHDSVFGAGHMPYSIKAQLDFAKKFIKENDDVDNPGLLQRILIDNLKFKSVLDNIINVIKIGEKDDAGYTKKDVTFCKELILSIDTIPAITDLTNAVDVDLCNTQKELRKCLDSFRSIVTTQTQLKCVQEEFGFNSVGAVKSKSHRYRKFMKEEHDRKMVISEITENKMHQYTGEAIDKYDTGEIKTKCVYKNGLLSGSYTTFYKNGVKNSVKIYKDGMLDGDYREFYDNTKPKLVGQYTNNVCTGAWTRYREDGSKDELYVIDNEGNKMFELYDIKGDVEESGTIRING